MKFSEKFWVLRYYGFRITRREIFDETAPQADRPAVKTTEGSMAVWEPESDIDGWALVGDDLVWLLDQTLDTLDKVQIDEALPEIQKYLT